MELFSGALIAGFLALVRVTAGIAAVARLYEVLPAAGKVALATIFAALSVSACDAQTLLYFSESTKETALRLACVELARGILISLPVALALEVLPVFGRICDTARGNQIAEQLSLDLLDRVSPLEALGAALAPIALFQLGILQLFAAHLFLPPPGAECAEAAASAAVHADISGLLRLAASTLSVGLCIAGAMLVFSLVLDAAGGALSRILSRVNFHSELQPVKLVLGLLIACFALEHTGLFAAHLQHAVKLQSEVFESVCESARTKHQEKAPAIAPARRNHGRS